jgi:multidrug efflux pump subunit AcrA (membrane-fusion protein)
VQRVSPTLERDSSQFRVTGIFDPPAPGEPALLPGMLVRLRIATDRHANALVVPKRAVRREGDFTYVLRIVSTETADTVERVLTGEGYEDGGLVELILNEPGSLDAGDRVVSVGSRDLEDGDPVRIDGDEAGEPEPKPKAEGVDEELSAEKDDRDGRATEG